MYPQKPNPSRGWRFRQWKRREQIRTIATDWQPEVFSKEEKTMWYANDNPNRNRNILGSGCGCLALLVAVLLLAWLIFWNPLGIHLTYGPQLEPTQAYVAPAYVAPTAETPIVSDPALNHGNGNPQPYISHPNFYVETTVSAKEYVWNFVVNEGEIGIVGGFTVNGVSNGSYVAYGPGKYTVKVTDGFALTVEKKWAKAEWDFRIGQAVQYNWAHSHLDAGPIK